MSDADTRDRLERIGLALPGARAAQKIVITGRPVEIQATERFSVEIATPPVTCHRCKVVITGEASLIVVRDAQPGTVYRPYCATCVQVVMANVRAGITCSHDVAVGAACEDCHPPRRDGYRMTYDPNYVSPHDNVQAEDA